METDTMTLALVAPVAGSTLVGLLATLASYAGAALVQFLSTDQGWQMLGELIVLALGGTKVWSWLEDRKLIGFGAQAARRVGTTLVNPLKDATDDGKLTANEILRVQDSWRDDMLAVLKAEAPRLAKRFLVANQDMIREKALKLLKSRMR